MFFLESCVTRHTPCDTDHGWNSHGSKCYKKIDTTNGWRGARHDCLWEGGDLVSITSEEEEKFVKEQMGDKPFWIGLSNLVCDKDHCKLFEEGQKRLTWSDTGVTPTYANWTSNQGGSSDNESCAYVNQGVHEGSQPGKWRHGSCGSSLAYMCERSPDDCPDGWPCSYKDLGYTYSRVETSYCDSGEFLYNDSCYLFEGRLKTWQEAEDFCKEEGGLLASVHSKVDGLFLSAHGQGGSSSLFYSWLGLKKNNGKFEWRDGSSTVDVPWHPHNYSGACTKLDGAGQVQIDSCTSVTRPSICQKGKARASLPPLPASASGKSAKCGLWRENPANDFCYLIHDTANMTWKEARDECARRRGNLLAITDLQDHNFIHGVPGSGSSLWLDASDTNVEVGSKQSDESSPSSVLLGASDPPGRRCNSLLHGKSGMEVVDCEKKRGYVCRRRGIQTCEMTNGWHGFGSSCYRKMETTNGWLGARYDCVWEGGDLVSITSEDEEKFVTEQMGDKPFWIGLSNLDCNEVWCQFFKAGEKRLTWSDTAMTPIYANWTSSQDGSSNDESCTYVRQGVHVDSQPGKWRHGSCGSSLAYMCERPLDACPLGRLCSYKDYGFSYSRAETSSCDTGDFLYRDSCFHFEGMKRTWEAAEVFCREWNGHLASVHSLFEGQFLAAHAPYAGGVQSWVGLKKNKDNFEWSDATPTGNIVWVPNGPKGRGGCSALSPTGQLEDWPCTKSQPFICRKAMVQEFVLPPPAGWSAKCGWWLDRSSDDLCYLIQHKPTKTWQKARDDCLLRGGDLLSIADSNEQTVIQGLYTSLSSAPALWLGVNNDITKDGSEWTDGSPFGYMFMDRDDPGDLSGASCLSLLTRNGRWKFDDCRKKRGYICKKRGIPAKPQQPLHALTHHEPACDTVNGWSPHGSNCYKKMETPNGWLGARHNCLWEGGDLVSITSEDEEMFVMEQMGNKPFWIGLSNLNCNETWCQFFKAGEKSVTWSYTSVTPTYANWDPRQDQSSDDESCVYVNQGVHGDSQPSKWRRGSCRSSLAYMCERSPDDCPDGWPCSYKDLGYTYSRVETSYCDSNEFLYKDSCYHFEVTPKTWQAAEDFCKEKRGFLASVHSPVDRRFLAAHVREGFQPWLGLKKSSAKFEWLDGSCTENVTKNLTQNSDDCAKLNENGGIQLEGCTDLRPSICQKGKARASLPLLPASASASGKSAKCGWWQENPANDLCYLINSKPTKTWKEARDECARLRGNLLAITDSNEHTFIRGLLPSGSSLWLDASDIIVEVGSKQSDESSPSSVLLGAGNPGDPPGRRCNSLLGGKGGIEVVDCEKKRGYVCKRRVVQTCERTKGWRRFGSNCYKKMETTNGWLGARYDCVWEGGDLVSITSTYEESFVKEQMGDKPFWIGRSNLNCDVAWCQFFEAGEKRLSLSDTGVTPTYANWDSRQDRSSSDHESCAYVNQGVHVESQPGKWRHGSCGSSLAYMCERPLDACPDGRLCSYKDYAFGYNRVETSYCGTGDFLYRDSCYHFEGMKRTWEAAEKFCREWNGHLASVQSLVDSQFLAAHAPDVGGLQSWVGLKKNKNNFEWSDATPTGNIVWVPNGPTGRGDCCALSPTGQVEDWPCTNIRPFICKKAKVQEFVLPPPAGWSAKCGWWPDRSSDDFCYLIQHRPTKTWQKARDDCLRRGGDLLSIADSREQAFIQSLYTSLSSAPSLWLGANNKIMKDGSEWTDGSPFGYMFMDRDDPGDLFGASCLSLLTSNGRWKFADCRKKRGYICKKRRIPAKPQQPLHALTHHEPTCDTVNGWSPHGSNCYKKMETPNGWLGARHNCLWEGGDLVSITSEDEEMFVMEQMGNKPFWIGLSNLNCNETWCQFFKAGEKSVTWSYTSVTPTYANWDPRQDQSSDDESCVYVNQGVHGDSQPSKWRRGSCRSSLAYMCERSPDDCPDGWPCSYKDLGYTYSRVETSYCDSNEFLYKDSCYHFEETPKTWQAAEDFCKEKRGLLASIPSSVDRRFLAAHVREGSQPWLGLKKRTFEWLDRSSTDNVTKNHTQNSDDCAKLNENGEIQLEGCTGLRPSICQKGKARASLPLLPASASASGKSAKCGWWRENPANDFCYLIHDMANKTWMEARDKCTRLRGNLLAITDSNEHTFIRGLLPSGSSLWLDASDIIVQVGSKQSDESSPSSVLLGAGNPGDPPGRRCNSLLGGKGGIEVVDCKTKRGYVCKRRVVQTCERTKGWRRFGSNCYKKMETTNGWLGARYDCVWEGGDLVSITSTYEESFVKEQMGDKPFWIGRSNLNCDVAWCQFFEAGEKRLSLSDTGVTPTYANWDSRQDRSSNNESCAYVNQGVHVESQPGKWRHGSCGSSLAYMCERPLDACPDGRLCSYKDYAFGYNRVETSYCGTGDFLYRDSCYHFEGMKRTWEAAEKFCREWNGHLASVQSLVDSQFLAAHAPDVGGLQSWVGLKKNKNNFEWSDATPTGNIAWVPNGPTGRGDCCALSPTGQVEDWPCTNIRPFICKKAKVQEFVLPPPAGWSAKCGWWPDRSSDDSCYLIQRRPTKTWQKARDDCLRHGGDLLSIADSREQAFIQSLYTFLPSSPSLWLGANNNITKDGSEWTDGSPFRYVVMDGDDPGDLSGASCLSLLTSNGRWKFDDCRKKRGYICKKRGIPAKPQQPLDELSDHEPTCDTVNGWSPHSSNCYKKMETTNGWLGARYKCVWEGGDLVSITSEDEEKFVKEKMGDKPFWIGLSNLNCDEAWCQFSEAGEKMLTWSDTGLTPTYANRDFRQDGSSTIESCAYVNQGVQVDSQPGKWRHGSCRSSLAYMCKRPPNACPEGRLCSYKDYGFGYNRVETSSCDTGNFLYKDSCYHFERMKQTWEGAERFCGKWNGHLASVLSWDEGKFLAAHAPSVRGLQSWVGLKKNKDNFEWSDATPTGNIVWVPNGPKGRGGCSSLSPTGQLEDWPCTESQPFICKKAMVQEFVLPPPAGWSAKCGWWLDRSSDDFCYLIQRRPTKTWQKARDDCLRRGGDLLSITDSHEQAFIQSLYTFLPSAPSLWLGVNNNITKDGSEWTDGSPFGYVLMDGDDPGDLSGASCLSLLTRNGRWKFDDCRKKRGYICKKRGKTPKPSKPHDSFKEILVCNNRSADLVCEGEGQNQSRISIQSAFYGRRSDDVCSEDSDSYDDEYCAVEGILPRYRKMCNGHQKCHIELLEDDSCPATSKYLEMVYSCEHKVCLDSLGIADGSLADSFFKASSSMEDATPEKARLNGESCWKPSKDPVGSWIQVNLGHKRKVTAIVTQGCDSDNTRSWDIQLEMKVSVDRRKWTKHPNGKFIGGETHLLETPAFAQYVRILPLENRPEFGLRLDILGCAHDDAMTCARRFNSLHLTDSMTFYCPPGCAKHVVFGTLVYSESSHICAAAIHAGVIQNNIGGDCIVMRAPKQQVYTGSTGNGIISRHLDDPLGVSYTFADGEPRCSAPDWEEFAGFCYKPFDDERDWADAQQVCRGFGAELVSIRTKVEQAWVKNASNFETSDMWTGLNDLALPGMFVWSDRHKVTFTPWAAGEPNQRVALGKHCVALLRQTGKWKLMSCTQVNSFMCKMPTVRFPIT
nr:uncharacterized protein LOC125979185 isoform X7 [Syngnathus scovelli]